MNIPIRNEQFLSFLQSLKPTQAQVGAVAEAIGCPEWVNGCCAAPADKLVPSECYCAKGAEGVLRLVGQTNVRSENTDA